MCGFVRNPEDVFWRVLPRVAMSLSAVCDCGIS